MAAAMGVIRSVKVAMFVATRTAAHRRHKQGQKQYGYKGAKKSE
jgi:hypothetical protein